jgi:hypothetical protein
MKKTLSVIVITLIVIWLVLQVIIRPVAEAVATRVVGARVSIGGFSINIFNQRIGLTDLQIYNEEGFPPGIFFKASQILVHADIPAVLTGKLHFPLIIFHLDKMIIYKNKQGKLNVDELKIVQEKLHDKNKGPAPNFKIDELKLNIAQVVVEDDSQTPPLVQAYDLNLKDKTFHDVNSPAKLVGLLLVETLKPTAIQSAGMYAASALLGVGFLPGLAIGLAVANDEAASKMTHSAGEVYDRALELMQRLGQVKKYEREGGTKRIFAKVSGCDITLTVTSEGWSSSKIVIKARKYFLPKPEVAAGLLYQLKEKLR